MINRKRYWLFCLLLLAFTGCAAQQRQPEIRSQKKLSAKMLKTLESRYQRGVQLQLQNQHENAQMEFSSLIQSLQKDGQAQFALPYYGLGVSLLNLEKAQVATEAFSTALSLKPGFYQAHLGLGRSQRVLGKYADAERSYLAALKYGKEDRDFRLTVYFNLGILYDVYLSKPNQARKYYQEYVQAGGPESVRVQSWLGFLGQK